MNVHEILKLLEILDDNTEVYVDIIDEYTGEKTRHRVKKIRNGIIVPTKKTL